MARELMLADAWISGIVRIALLVVATFSGEAAGVRTVPSWPQIAIPEGMETFDMGEQVTMNGVPMRMLGFRSSATPAQAAGRFRESLGKPFVENEIGSNLVLGRARGEHYVTVQIVPAGTGVRGIIAITSLADAIANRDATRATEERLLSSMPPASSLVSRTNSVDGKNSSEQLIFTNLHSLEINVTYVKKMLESSGFTLERETRPGDRGLTYRGAASNERRPLFFKAKDGEAIAVIFQDSGGRTAVVLSTITFLERTK